MSVDSGMFADIFYAVVVVGVAGIVLGMGTLWKLHHIHKAVKK